MISRLTSASAVTENELEVNCTLALPVLQNLDVLVMGRATTILIHRLTSVRDAWKVPSTPEGHVFLVLDEVGLVHFCPHLSSSVFP